MLAKKDIQFFNRNNYKDIYHLCKFKLPNDEMTEVFPRAYALPPFFTCNLQSRRRKVKLLSGTDAAVRAFYFQLMKLALQVEVEEVDYVELIRSKLIGYDLFQEGELEDQYFSDFQYRKFIKDFIQIVQEDDIPHFQETISMYPIVDEILLKMFKSLVPIPLLMPIPTTPQSELQIVKQILQILSQLFKVTFTQFDRCFKFQQSDVFIYVQNRDELYAAFDEHTQRVEDKSDFQSTFVCGQNNSFLTKYHSHSHCTKKTNLSNGHTKLSFLNMKTAQQQETTNQNATTHKAKQHSTAKQCFQSIMNKDRYQPGKNDRQNNNSSYYRQFTNTIILKAMNDGFAEDVRKIKDKYRRRENIKTFI